MELTEHHCFHSALGPRAILVQIPDIILDPQVLVPIIVGIHQVELWSSLEDPQLELIPYHTSLCSDSLLQAIQSSVFFRLLITPSVLPHDNITHTVISQIWGSVSSRVGWRWVFSAVELVNTHLEFWWGGGIEFYRVML